MKFTKWCYLLNKRLYRKPVFLIILLLIPLLTFGYTALSRQDGGIMTIALAQKDNSDPLGQQIIADLKQSSQLVRFLTCETPEEAREQVLYGKADSAWIFDEDLQNKICSFVYRPTAKNAFIQVLEREESVVLLLTREKLSGLVFTYISPEIYLQYIEKNVPELASVPRETLLAHYDSVSVDGTLFSYATQEETLKAESYLLTPVRGLLAIVTLLCGMASAMFYTEDMRQGLFSRIPLKYLPGAEFVCQMIAVSNVAIITAIALLLSGLTGSFFRELLLLILYAPCVSLFAMVLRRIFRGIRLLGILTPLLIVISLCACPVFLDFVPLRTFGLILPPTLFIRGAYDAAYIGYMVCHCAICAALCWLFDHLFAHK